MALSFILHKLYVSTLNIYRLNEEEFIYMNEASP